MDKTLTTGFDLSPNQSILFGEWTEVILCISDALQRTEAVFDVDSKFFVLDDIDFL